MFLVQMKVWLSSLLTWSRMAETSISQYVRGNEESCAKLEMVIRQQGEVAIRQRSRFRGAPGSY